MKKIFTLFLALVATTALWAHYFSVGGIYYNILTDKTNEVEVTFRGSDYDSYSNEYSGSVTIPSTVTYNGITYSVTSIGNHAFYDCRSQLTSVTIGNSVTSIGNHAFYYCRSLTSVTIGNSVTSIGENAFFDCRSLTSIIVEEGNSIYDSRENCNAIIETNSNTLVAGCKNTTIPNSVTNIGERAFYYCSGLTSVTIPNSVTSIGDEAFYYCSGLTSVTIPNSVTSIGDEAFFYCSNLTSVTIPNSVTSIGENAFGYCSGLTSIVVEEGNSIYDSRENCNAIIEINSNTLVAGCKNTTIPNSVTSIGDEAFRDCYELTSITIPNSVTSIGENAFAWCSRLTSVTIPNSVTSIGHGAFYNCYRLTSVNVFAEVPPTLGTDAFYYVSTRIPVYVPCGSVSAYQSVKGWNAFTNIQELQMEYSIQVYTSNRQMGSSKVNYNNCTSHQISATPNYGYHFVQWSDGNTDNPRTLELTQDTILTAEFAQTYSGQCGDNLYWSFNDKTLTITGFGAMWNERPWGLFVDEIQHVVLPNAITHIGDDAFSDCTGLNEITIPYTVTSIGDYAFAGCTKLYDIYCFAMEPPTAYESSFANYNAFLHVPCDNQRVYLLDVLFGNFKYIECIEAETTPTDTVVVTPSFNDAEFIWPTNSSADSYTLAISKDGEVFCTLTFNANGQLTGIAFAPSRNGQHNAPAAAQTANGFAFTVTGLDEGSNYTYDLLIQDRSGNTLQSYSGEFRTQSTNDRTVTVEYDAAQGQVTGAGTYLVGDTVTLTATPNDGYRFVRWSNEVVDNPYTFVITENITLSAEFEKVIASSIENTHSPSPMTNRQKLLRDGQLIIVRDGKTYNAMGVEM